MSFFIPCSSGFRTAVENRTDDNTIPIWWRVVADPDGAAIDLTSRIDNNQISGGHSGEFSVWNVQFRNSDDFFSAGDYAETKVEISVKVGGGNEYLLIATGYVETKGFVVSKGSNSSTKKASFQLVGRNKTKGMKRKPTPAMMTGFDICNPSTPSSSLLHKLASELGIVPSDVVSGTIDIEKDFIQIGDETAWNELKKLTEQYLGTLFFRYDDKLVFTSRFENGWSEPASEWTFNQNNLRKKLKEEYQDVQCNKAKTQFDVHADLGSRPIYRNVTGWNAYTKQIEIVVPAGGYWPGPNEGDRAQLKYVDPASGEEFPFGTSIQTPTIGTIGSGSDIECEGGLLSLHSFNGLAGTSPLLTAIYPGYSEIILRNNTGSPITIRKFSITGNAWRVEKNVQVQHLDGAVTDEIDEVEKTLDGKYAANTTQANMSVNNLVEDGKIKRRKFPIETAFLPMIQKGAAVTVEIPGGSTSSYEVVGYKHISKGPYTQTYTTIDLEELKELTSAGTPVIIEVETGQAAIEHNEEVDDELSERPTYTELTGSDSEEVTAIPEVPVSSQVFLSGFYSKIVGEIKPQEDLVSLKTNWVQVSKNLSDWYSLRNDGVDWKGTLNTWTEFKSTFNHINLKPEPGSDTTEQTFYYRFAREATSGAASGWSSAYPATVAPINQEEVVDNAIGARALAATAMATAEEGLEALYSFDDGLGVDPVDRILHLKFQNNLKDASIAKREFTAIGSPTVENGVLSCPETGNHISVPISVVEFGMKEITVAFTVTPHSIDTAEERYAINFWPGILIHLSRTWEAVGRFYVNTTGGYDSNTFSLNEDERIRIVCTFDGITMRINKNGQLYTSKTHTYPGLIACGTSTLSVGNDSDAAFEDIIIDSRKWSQAEVAADSETSGKETNYPKSDPAWEHYFNNNSSNWWFINLIKTDFPTFVRVEGTSSDPYMKESTNNQYIDGSKFRYVYVRCRLSTSTTFQCFYSTTDYDDIGRKDVAVTANSGVWQTIRFDMHNLTSVYAGDYWKQAIITNVRLDPGTASGIDVDIAWIKVGDQFVEGLIRDNAGAEQNGQIKGHPSFLPGKAGRAIYFGGGDYIEIEDHPLKKDISCIVTFWFIAAETDQIDYPGIFSNIRTLYAYKTTGNRINVSTYDGTVARSVPLDGFLDGDLHFVALVRDRYNNTMSAFVDCTHIGTVDISSVGDTSTTESLKIGAHGSFTARKMLVDEFRIFTNVDQATLENPLPLIMSYYMKPDGATPTMTTTERLVAKSVDAINVKTNVFVAALAYIGKVLADQVDAFEVNAVNLFAKNLSVLNGFIKNLLANTGFIQNLVVTDAFFENAVISHIVSAEGNFGALHCKYFFNGLQSFAYGSAVSDVITWLSSISLPINTYFGVLTDSLDYLAIKYNSSSLWLSGPSISVVYSSTETLGIPVNIFTIWEVMLFGADVLFDQSISVGEELSVGGEANLYDKLIGWGGATFRDNSWVDGSLTITSPNRLVCYGHYSNTTGSSANVFISSAGFFYRSVSSLKYKTDIEDVDRKYSKKIFEMRPVWYRSLCEADPEEYSFWGLIAEELAEIDPRLVHYGYEEADYEEYEEVPEQEYIAIEKIKEEITDEESGEKKTQIKKQKVKKIRPAIIGKRVKSDAVLKPEGVQYDRITVLLLKEIQEMRKEIDELKAKV